MAIISIHAPREGGDAMTSVMLACFRKFQSTPPAKGATSVTDLVSEGDSGISIHAPREGGDPSDWSR